MADDWSESEVLNAVKSYFRMLELELRGETPNKTEHRRELLPNLNDRSGGSVEYKHQNISAVLIQMGIPYIDGYKPRFNYQKALEEAVQEYLARNRRLHHLLADDADAAVDEPSVPTVDELLAAWEDPPAADGESPPVAQEQEPVYSATRIDYLGREARNQALGRAGELFVINFERARLIQAGRESLAERIEHVAENVGPSAGFDVKSYEEDGTDRFIEAKTTKYGKYTPFFISPNELQLSRENRQHYCLYRVYKFRDAPRLYVLRGHVRDRCTLAPSEYRAWPAGSGSGMRESSSSGAC